ncbi:MAG: hypothetical protein JWP66_1879 [Naasia sp.]|nr:hypothetical protein [Naasia sp.]
MEEIAALARRGGVPSCAVRLNTVFDGSALRRQVGLDPRQAVVSEHLTELRPA